jgi:hypothetical protein
MKGNKVKRNSAGRGEKEVEKHFSPSGSFLFSYFIFFPFKSTFYPLAVLLGFDEDRRGLLA